MSPRPAPPAPPVPLRPRRRLAWQLVAVLSAVCVLVPAGRELVRSQGGHTRVLTGGSAGRPVAALEIAAGDAHVSLTPRVDRQVGYLARLGWSLKPPVIEESWLGDTLKLTSRCPGAALLLAGGADCTVDLGVTVPAGIPVRVTAGSGTVEISGLEGPVEATVDSGRLRLTGLRGPVRARVGSGELTAMALASRSADISAGSGHAVARFLSAPDRVSARVGTGELEITVPPAVGFRVTSRTGSGAFDLADGLSDPAAPRGLDVRVGAGHASVGFSG